MPNSVTRGYNAFGSNFHATSGPDRGSYHGRAEARGVWSLGAERLDREGSGCKFFRSIITSDVQVNVLILSCVKTSSPEKHAHGSVALASDTVPPPPGFVRFSALAWSGHTYLIFGIQHSAWETGVGEGAPADED